VQVVPRYGYARCSTKETRQDIERQKRELNACGVDKIFSEYISGTKLNRPQYDTLMELLKKGDTLVATETSRLTRSLHQLCHLIEDVKTRQIRLEIGSLTLDYTNNKKVDAMHLAMFYITGVFAELERGATVERIRSGLENAKKKGVRMGRPRKSREDVPQVVKNLLPAYESGKLSKKDYALKAGITRPTLYKYLRLLSVEI